jgi:SM-20-related protein
MSQQFNILDLDTVKKAKLHQEPFPYMIIDNILQTTSIANVVNDFPSLHNKRGNFPLSSVNCTGHFARLINELEHPELRSVIAQRFDMNLNDKPSVITLRGHTTERDGHIHTDASSKLITVLLYLNPNWTSSEGCLRLLYNKKNLEPYAAEIEPEAGRCLIFKVMPNGWHGHKVFIGERRSIQLNYVTSLKAAERHLRRHRLSAYFKKLIFKHDANLTY